MGKKYKNLPKASPKRFQKIAPDVKLGEGVQIHNFVNLYGCEIGDRTKVGSFVEIQKGVRIGKNCKISSHSFICEGVSIGDGVFVGIMLSLSMTVIPERPIVATNCKRKRIGLLFLPRSGRMHRSGPVLSSFVVYKSGKDP
jgi:carbonic anhydrase/acetyltransferase-like protein (isoleucine patch superfamily)